MNNKTSDPRSFDRDGLVHAAQSGELRAYLDDANSVLDRDDWDVFVSVSATLWNERMHNLPQAIKESSDGRLRHSGRRWIADIVPLVRSKLPVILEDIALATGGDLSDPDYPFSEGLSKWFEGDENRFDEALYLADQGVAGTYLNAAFTVSLRKRPDFVVPLLVEMVQSGDNNCKLQAVFSLGRYEVQSDSHLALIAETLVEAISLWPVEDVPKALEAALHFGRMVPDDTIVARAIGALGEVTPEIRAALAHAILDKGGRKFGEEELASVLTHLAQPESGDRFDLYDIVIYTLLEDNQSDVAVDLLTSMLRTGVVKLGVFDSTMHKVRSDTDVFANCIGRWLTEDADHLSSAVSDLLMNGASDAEQLSIDFRPFQLSTAQTIAAGRRAVGQLMVWPKAAMNVLISLVRTGPQAAHSELEALMFDPLLTNYWQSPRELLEATRNNDEPAFLTETVDRVLDRHDDYCAAIETVGFIPEFRQSEANRFYAALLRHEEQEAIYKSAPNGALADLFPTSLMLFGDSSVYRMHTGDGETVRQEAALSTFETSQEIPRMEIADPTRSWLQRVLYSQGKKLP